MQTFAIGLPLFAWFGLCNPMENQIDQNPNQFGTLHISHPNQFSSTTNQHVTISLSSKQACKPFLCHPNRHANRCQTGMQTVAKPYLQFETLASQPLYSAILDIIVYCLAAVLTTSGSYKGIDPPTSASSKQQPIKFASSLPGICFSCIQTSCWFRFWSKFYAWFGRFTRCLPLD